MHVARQRPPLFVAQREFVAAAGQAGVSRVEGSWEVVSAEYTATTAMARVRLFNSDGETFRTFFAQGQRVSIDGVEQTQVAMSDLCTVRSGG